MDSSFSASRVAAQLGTTVPRVVRAAKRLGYDSRSNRGRFAFTADQVQRLQGELGVTEKVQGLSASESVALAALARSPLGLPSARAIATGAGISPTAASRAVKSLVQQGLVRRDRELIVAGRPRYVLMFRANRRHPRYQQLSDSLRNVVPARRARDQRVPARLAHNFWNTNPAQLEVAHGSKYIARRLLRTMDPVGLAWGARNLRAEDWLAAAQSRGLDPSTKALALNLAADSDQ